VSPKSALRFRHLLAEFEGIPKEQLGDPTLLSGLVLAAATAAGLGASEVPVVRMLPAGGMTVLLLQEHAHMIVHTVPERALLLLDVLAPAARDSHKALDVFARRLTAREIRNEVHDRG
jgi:S-adenosylmethionine/arginine decarboxylase-like enzyme